jgi:hypothetical protein
MTFLRGSFAWIKYVQRCILHGGALASTTIGSSFVQRHLQQLHAQWHSAFGPCLRVLLTSPWLAHAASCFALQLQRQL